jgi:ribulose-phosphate 3-epimerase
MTVRINPSILSADFVNMQMDLNRISSADFAHVDVMDNHFVPNLTFGPQMVSRIQDVSPVPLDVHLMIDKPEIWAPGYAELGCYSVTFHAEASQDPVSLAQELRKMGSRAGLAIKPGTPIDSYLEILQDFDQILIMTVEPGFGGQKFISDVMPKLKHVSDYSRKNGLDIWVQVDGGITLDTIVEASENGADTFVAGSSVYGAENPEEAIAALRVAASHGH